MQNSLVVTNISLISIEGHVARVLTYMNFYFPCVLKIYTDYFCSRYLTLKTTNRNNKSYREMYYKSVTMCLLLVALLLQSTVSSNRSVSESSEDNPMCRGISGESDIMMLDCSWQGLTSVPAISPGQLVHLLDISHNTLPKLHNGSFHPYPNLTHLILSSDSIATIEVNTFSILKALRIVDLSYNNLKFIHPNLFLHNTNLETLSLQGNPLYPLESRKPLLIAISLQSLDLSHCHLMQFSTQSLSGLPELKILDLRHNSLQQLSVNNMPALSSLQLAGNPWQCDCHFHSLLMLISANQMMHSDIRTDNTVQCWQRDELKNLTTMEDQNSICREVTGLTVSQNIISDLVATDSKKDENIHSKEENPEVEIKTWLDDDDDDDDDEDDDDDDVFGNYDDFWMSADSYQDYEDYEKLDKNSALSSAAAVPSFVHQDYTGLNLTVSSKFEDNRNKVSRKDEITNSTIQLPRILYNFIPEDTEVSFYDEFSSDYEDSEELYMDSFSLLSAEIPSSDHRDDMNLNLAVSVEVGDNHTEDSRRDEVTDSTIQFPRINDEFIPEDTEGSFYEYEFYGEYQDSEELSKDSVSASEAEIPNLKHEYADVRYILDNSDLQTSDIKNETTDSTTGFSIQNNGFIAPDYSRLTSNSILTVNNKDNTLNSSRYFDYTFPATESPSEKYEDHYESVDEFIILENLNSEETIRKDDTDSTILLPSTYDDYNPEDITDIFAFVLDEELVNNEISPSTTKFPNLIDEGNFNIHSLSVSFLKYLYSDADDQEHKTLISHINAKSPNEMDLSTYTIIKSLILAGMISVVMFVLVVTVYCITSVCFTPSRSMQMNVYEKLEETPSKERLLQNV